LQIVREIARIPPHPQESQLGTIWRVTGSKIDTSLHRKVWCSAKHGYSKISPVTQSGNAIDVAISQDGRYVVYVLRGGEKQSLNVRQLPAPMCTLIPHMKIKDSTNPPIVSGRGGGVR
jgi:hypothetical protein